MTIAQLFETVEGRLFNLDHSLRYNPRVQLHEEADALCEKLQELYPVQSRRFARLAQARQEFARQEIEATMLGSRIEASIFANNATAAWQQALKLDRLRQSLQDKRLRLDRLEERATDECTVIRSMEDRLSLLQQKLYS